MRNIPYVKAYNEDGEVSNPIQGIYSHDFENRKTRREPKNKIRFMNNRKTTKLKVIKTNKFYRLLQLEKDKDGNTKRIEHFLNK